MAERRKDLLTYLGDPHVRFVELARAFGIAGKAVKAPRELGPAVEGALIATREGRPYVLDIDTERWGPGSELASHPAYSIAAMRHPIA
jgi:thiamine pyrophosphate-dependent acetolactate synthase large subunit-like protein